MTPAHAGLVLLQLLGSLAVGWAMGDLLARWGGLGAEEGQHEPRTPYGAPEKALLAIVGFVLFCAFVMVLHIVGLGLVFPSRWIVPLLAGGLVFWRRKSFSGFASWRGKRVIPLALLLLGIYALPIVNGGPAARTGDTPWHLGWTEQILNGDAVPSGPAPEVGRNAYPWGFHAVMASTVELVPGSDPLLSLDTLHLLTLAGIPLAGACIARRLYPGAGLPAAAATSLIGGFGWLSSEPFFETVPSNKVAGADLVVASPNSVYELLPPASPRELALVLLGALVVLLMMALRESSNRTTTTAGVVSGLVGLVSVPLFLTSLMFGAATAFLVPAGRRTQYLKRFFAASTLTIAPWALPVVVNFLRYGGFVNITPQLGVEWPLPTALASWGLLLPLSLVGGGCLFLRRADRVARAGLVYVGTVAALLLLAIARGRFDWQLAGNATLFHQGRVWPVAHLLAGAFAGVAVAWAVRSTRASARSLSVLAAACLFALGAISPVLASGDLTQTMRSGKDGFIYGDQDLDGSSFVSAAAAHLSPRDILGFPNPPDLAHRASAKPEMEEIFADASRLAFLLFQFSGTCLESFDDPRLDGNDLRIRYEDLARQWDGEIEERGRFAPTHLLVLDPTEVDHEEQLASGRYDGVEWHLLSIVDSRRYGPSC